MRVRARVSPVLVFSRLVSMHVSKDNGITPYHIISHHTLSYHIGIELPSRSGQGGTPDLVENPKCFVASQQQQQPQFLLEYFISGVFRFEALLTFSRTVDNLLYLQAHDISEVHPSNFNSFSLLSVSCVSRDCHMCVCVCVVSLVSQGEELPTGFRDARNPGDHGDPQTLVTERPLRHGGEILFVLHQILVPVT